MASKEYGRSFAEIMGVTTDAQAIAQRVSEVVKKQDCQGARTPSELEQKYQFDTRFAEIMGVATDAQRAAQQANSSLEGLDQEAVFNLLTNNGTAQGLYRGDDGELYINASYIASGLLKSLNGVTTFNLSTGDLVCKNDTDESYAELGNGRMLFGKSHSPYPAFYMGNLGFGGGIIFSDPKTGQDFLSMCGELDALWVDGKDLRITVDKLLINGGTVYPDYLEGVEYKLPEKYNGKAVYTKMVSVGQLANDDVITKPLDGIDLTKIISITGRCFKDTEWNEFPVIALGSAIAYHWVDSAGLKVKSTKDMSAYSAEFIIKYYKDEGELA